MDKRGRTEGVSRYSVKSFCLTVPKNFVGEPFCVSQSFWYRNKLWIRGGGRKEYHDILSNLFVSQYRKTS